MKPPIIENPFTITVDSREQRPYRFKAIRSDARQSHRPVRVETEWGCLSAGDYSIKTLESIVAIERKSLPDLFGSIGRGHARFRREHERLATLQFAAVVVEGTWADVLFKPPAYSRIKPKIVFRTVMRWSMRYNVHWHFVGGRNPAESRRFGEQTVYRLLSNFWELHHETSET